MKREIKDHPILFSTPMVQAILEGRKTQTRRVVKQSSGWDPIWKVSHEGNGSYCMRTGTQYSIPFFKCPYGQPGDVIWVRETWRKMQCGYDYKADFPDRINFKWKPSIHMPKDACRLFLRIKNVRVERLKEISEQDAISEGIKGRINGAINAFSKPFETFYDYENEAFPTFGKVLPKDSFKSLWKSINGEQSWIDNPWVWVIEFERV
jgi:hypothetical protein